MATPALDPKAVQAIVNSTLGPLVAGGFFTTFFFGLICLQTAHYLRTFPNDRLLVKILVLFLWVAQLVFTLCICQGTYAMAVTDFGRLAAFKIAPWGLDAGQILGGVIDHLIQAFFVFQIYRATHRLVLCIFLWILVALLEVLAAYLCAQLLKTHSISITFGNPQNHRLLMLLFFGDATMDLVNAAILCFHLRAQRKSAFSKRTISLVDHLLVYTLQTGLTTSFVAFAAAISYAVSPDNYTWVVFFEFLPSSFLGAFLANINNRAGLRIAQDSHKHGTPSQTSYLSSGVVNTGNGSQMHPGGSGVQVQISRNVVFARDRDLITSIGSVKAGEGEYDPELEERAIEMNKMELDTQHHRPEAV
ncbi:hypothetical protein MIND_00596300 [Mycena indigotica]|uniref:DUF6534 domain-containing protein n=1 Tax=Mycena indigotica TaxID=2126181 RepID=A0A8H6W910_9AGAR|nr:uncharacterized protein MIND_00596300 [Mycena indigotica]KAF7303669.1 hypothetical protein MIND_00596300 [Mycena indigotica]